MGAQKELSLQESLAQLNREKRGQAQSMFDTGVAQDFQQQQFQEQIRQFNEQQAAASRAASQAAAASSYSFGSGRQAGGGSPEATNSMLPKIGRNASGGYDFSDPYGKPITAAEYAGLYKSQGGSITYRQLLQQMANTGDKNAKIALSYVGDDAKFGNAPAKFRAALSAVGATGSFAAASKPRANPTTNNVRSMSVLPNSGILSLGGIVGQ